MTAPQMPFPAQPEGSGLPAAGAAGPARRPGDGVLATQVRRAASLMGLWLAVLWVLVGVDALDGDRLLGRWGIVPRTVGGLPRVFTAPFLHTGVSHLAANSLPLFTLGLVAALTGIRRFLAVTLVVMVVSGLGVWALGPNHSVTVGASGLVFGYLGYLLLRGFVDRRPLDVLVTIGVGLLYGYLLWSVLAWRPGVSWQGHVFGFLGGLLAAWLLRRRRARPASDRPPGV